MTALIQSLHRNRRLLRDLVGRDLRARYVGSTMGFFWSVVFPLLNLIIYMFVFSFVLKLKWTSTQPDQEVALFMLAGIVVWQAFAESASRMTNTLVENQNLIQKVVFPSEVLPVYLTISAVINMAIGMTIALLGVAFFAWISPPEPVALTPEQAAQAALEPVRVLGFGISLVCIPMLIALQALFMLGFGYLMAALNLLLRDVYHLIGVAMTVWMFMTPIFYPAGEVQKAGLGWVLKINPMYWLIDSYRRVMIYGEWPKIPVVAAFALVALLVFLLGSTFFLRQKPRFPDLL